MSEPKPSPELGPTIGISSAPAPTGTGADTQELVTAVVPGGTPPCLGPYVLLGELGRGGMGVVYRAEDPHLKREVALKVMLPQHAANPQAKARFVREARAQAKVEHDHVAAIYQVSDHDGLPYIVMPLLKGMTLHAALKANPRPPMQEVIRIGREIAEGLAAAHEKGLVHRDIKPANVWLEGKRLRVKILDFGLARVADTDATADSEGPVTREGAVIGTPAYMSPEQGRGDAVDVRTDLWSLGVVLYQMTTGELPFAGPNVMAILTAIACYSPVPPHARNPAVPPALSHLILGLLSKDPSYRPTTAEVVTAELRAIESGQVNAARMLPQESVPSAYAVHGPDPFADLDATELSLGEGERPAVPPAGRGFPVWALVVGVLLAVAAVVGFVASQLGTRPATAEQDAAQPPPPRQQGPRQGAPPKKTEARPTARELRRAMLPSAAQCVAVSPDGKIVAVGCTDGLVYLLDAATGEQLRRLEGHGRRVLSVVFAPDGTLASGDDGASIRLWDTRTGETTRTLEVGGPSWVVAFSPDSRTLVGGGAALWDVKTGKPGVALADGRRDAAAFVPGTNLLVVGDYQTGLVQVLDTTTGEVVRRLAALGTGVRCVSISPDMTRVAVAFGRNNPPSDQPIPGDEYSVRVFDLATGNQLSRLDGHEYVVYHARYSPDGRHILTAGFDGTARLWDSLTGKEVCVIRPGGGVLWGASFNGNRTAVTAAASGLVTVWELPADDDEVVLFDGTDLSKWQRVKQVGNKPPWVVKDGYFEVNPQGGNHLGTNELFQDIQLHLEYWLPAKINANSGVYLQGCFEIQIFDDYGQPPSVSTTGALYGEARPSRNASKPAEEWQTMDITFVAPRDKTVGLVTVVHNGEKVVDAAPVVRVSPQAADWLRVGTRGPIVLQDHGSPVRFRNIRVRPLSADPAK